MRAARRAIDLMDGGRTVAEGDVGCACSLIDAGFPRPRTKFACSDGFAEAYIAMGWDGPKVGVDYDGDSIRPDDAFVHDIGRNGLIDRQGWFDVAWSSHTAHSRTQTSSRERGYRCIV